ncbi:general secretion pathway protein G [Clostridium tetanomorphum]|uniref:type II secretion system protein n=1 Tax=Clostridium tetanomorphum TaxID=1553 RepID=UPI0004523F72|nr:prepilin-type N-terminal cleavage/methylation domain-containing protein [Clostridium tetanomorphum]KAJ51629.1 hypothetical protein CTM_11840 [Clostridium tetanomorphum DSM 665]KAJ53636.1 hypothetical protein CTM_01609 [Clostridium tetanomorphum DSM 665]MBP1866241.1 general secretion pathway protein G [Clostridium tetanomorphum]NRS86015.1 general secretion pathway protein G [Clostridium tetanomorphum]
MIEKIKRGFTLVELLVVIAIIAILAAIIAPNAFKAIEKSKVSRTLSDMKSFKTAALQFYADVGFFPADVSNGIDPGLGSNSVYDIPETGYNFGTSVYDKNYIQIVKERWKGPYLDFPLSKKTAWGGEYDYDCWVKGVTVKFPYDEYINGQGNNKGKTHYGIYITIHGVPENSAKRIANESPFEVVPTNTGDKYGKDDIDIYKNKGLYKVVLKIADSPY